MWTDVKLFDFDDLNKIINDLVDKKDAKLNFYNTANCAYDEYVLDDDKNAKYIEIAVPGFSSKEITVEVEDDILKVTAHQGETTFSFLTRDDITFTKILDNPDVNVTAECANGILRLRLVNPEKKDTSRKIEVIQDYKYIKMTKA